jgi:hypothetical protein
VREAVLARDRRHGRQLGVGGEQVLARGPEAQAAHVGGRGRAEAALEGVVEGALAHAGRRGELVERGRVPGRARGPFERGLDDVRARRGRRLAQRPGVGVGLGEQQRGDDRPLELLRDERGRPARAAVGDHPVRRGDRREHAARIERRGEAQRSAERAAEQRAQAVLQRVALDPHDEQPQAGRPVHGHVAVGGEHDALPSAGGDALAAVGRVEGSGEREVDRGEVVQGRRLDVHRRPVGEVQEADAAKPEVVHLGEERVRAARDRHPVVGHHALGVRVRDGRLRRRERQAVGCCERAHLPLPSVPLLPGAVKRLREVDSVAVPRCPGPLTGRRAWSPAPAVCRRAGDGSGRHRGEVGVVAMRPAAPRSGAPRARSRCPR